MADTMKNITMTVVNATGGYDTLYPKTVAGQVYINSEKTKTLADHVADTDLHLSASERTALTKTNQAEGYLTLDAQGFVPTSKLNPASLAVKLEFANITEMLAATTDMVFPGQLVMVVDASADDTVTEGWAIYRRLTSAVDLTQMASWQKVAEKESLDVVVNWDNITGKPSSTVTAIDDAVAKAHEHANKTVIDKFTDAGSEGAPVLKYGEKTIATTDAVTTFTVVSKEAIPEASTLKVGDFVFVEE